MHDLMNQLVFSLLKKNNLQDCSVEELKTFANQYPFYPVARLLYTAKLKDADSTEYKNEIQKTSLHFQNPLWLNYLLSKKENETQPAAFVNNPVEIPFEDFNNDEIVVENPRHDIIPEITLIKETLLAPTSIQGEEKTEPAFVFEPYHTVDYFASQGIKNVMEEKPKDRFGQQLKSFTEWLKILKTRPAEQLITQTEKVAEENINILAVHSIEDRNVVTEAMAEVWIKQGLPEKAIAIYTKLSLLNPSKNSYFATLIENLKKN